MQAVFKEIKFSDSDVVNPEDFIPAGDYNPNNVRPFLMHDHGFVVAVVFADCLQDALDAAADDGRLDAFQLTKGDLEDYEEEEGVSHLGDAGQPFDIDSLDVVELPNPRFSFIALFEAMRK